MNKSNYLINELENLLKSLEAEDKDDQMCRQRYRDKWIRQPSQKLNFKLVQGAMNFLNSLNNNQKQPIVIEHADSMHYKGLQMADLISWSAFQNFENENHEFIDLIKNKVIKFVYEN